MLRLQGRKTIQPKAKESDPEPAAEVDAQPEPVDSFPQAKIVHRNRSRKPEGNAVDPWTPAQAQAAPVPPQPRQHAQG